MIRSEAYKILVTTVLNRSGGMVTTNVIAFDSEGEAMDAIKAVNEQTIKPVFGFEQLAVALFPVNPDPYGHTCG